MYTHELSRRRILWKKQVHRFSFSGVIVYQLLCNNALILAKDALLAILPITFTMSISYSSNSRCALSKEAWSLAVYFLTSALDQPRTVSL